MPNIYLKHARHGTKVAIAEAEAVADVKNGWERYDPTAPAVVEQKPKPGRPPKQDEDEPEGPL